MIPAHIALGSVGHLSDVVETDLGGRHVAREAIEDGVRDAIEGRKRSRDGDLRSNVGYTVERTRPRCEDRLMSAPLAAGFYGNDSELIVVTPSGRIWIVDSEAESPMLRELTELPREVESYDHVLPPDLVKDHLAKIEAASGESFQVPKPDAQSLGIARISTTWLLPSFSGWLG
jgi:hypothetical protein